MLYSFLTCVYTFLAGSITLSVIFSQKVLLVAEELACQRRKRKLSCKQKVVCAQYNIHS